MIITIPNSASTAAATTKAASYAVLDRNSDDNGSSLRPVSLQLVDEAIDSTIPLHEQTGYLKARRICPHLIQQESDPAVFLHYEKDNIWAAAQRLVRYWEWRTIIFGDTYAYTPILNLKVQKDTGNIDFLNILQYGSCIVLPGTDVYGNPIVFINSSRNPLPPEEMDNLRLLRLFFHTWTSLIQMQQQKLIISTNNNRNDNGHDHNSHDNRTVAGGCGGGVTIISVDYQIPAAQRHFIEFGRNFQSLLSEAFPMSFPTYHAVFLPNKTGWSTLTAMVVPFAVSQLSKLFSSVCKSITLHVCNNESTALNELQQKGITDPNILPINVGGRWSYQNYDIWFQQQLVDSSNMMLEQHHQGYSQPHNPSSATMQSNLGWQDFNSVLIKIPPVVSNYSEENLPSVTNQLLNSNNDETFLLTSAISCEYNNSNRMNTRTNTVSTATSTALSSIIPVSLQLVDDAINSTIPLHEKTAYLEARRLCPHLIVQESDPAIFLQYENYNIWAAAQRLVTYWEWRTIIFGDTYAYTPILNLKVQKDLGNLDFLELLQDGGIVVLPGTDRNGSSIVFMNISRYHLPFEEMDNLRLLRLVFYTWTLLIRIQQQNLIISTNNNGNDNGHENNDHDDRTVAGGCGGGVTIISVEYQIPSTTKHLIEFGRNLQSLLTEAFPISFPTYHAVFLPNKTGWSTLIGMVVPFSVSQISKLFRSVCKSIAIHVCNNESAALNELKQNGIADPNILPVNVGGRWSYENFDIWFQQQLLDGNNMTLEQQIQEYSQRNNITRANNHQSFALPYFDADLNMSTVVASIQPEENLQWVTNRLVDNNSRTSGNNITEPLPTRNKRRTEEVLCGQIDNDCSVDSKHSSSNNSSIITDNKLSSSSHCLDKKARKLPLKLSTFVSSSETQAAIKKLRHTTSYDHPQTSSSQWAVIDYWKQRMTQPSSPS